MGPASSHRPRAPRKALRSSQGGIAAIFAAVSLVTLLSAVALSIDIGRLYFADRNLQRLADLAAIDGARVQGQCLGEAGADTVAAEVAASLQRNGLPTGTSAVTLLGQRRSGEDGLRFFRASGSDEASDSVQVTLSRPSPARILPIFAGDAARALTVRAAASGGWQATALVGEPVNADLTGNFKPALFGGALGSNVGLSTSNIISGSGATVEISDLVVETGTATDPLPDIETPVPVQGLLSDIEAQLNQAGNTAGAELVRAFAAAAALGRPGGTVVPGDVLGLPATGAYDAATVPLGAILDAIAGSLANEPIEISNLCTLLPLDTLPTAQLLPDFCDTRITIRTPQASQSGTSNSTTQVIDVGDSSDSARSAGGLVEVRLGLRNPVTGAPINLSLKGVAKPAQALVTNLSCARVGQAKNLMRVDANGPEVTFAIGNSNTFSTAMTSPTVDLDGVLNDVTAMPVLTTSVADLLGFAGVGGLLTSLPVNLAFLGQPVTVSARLPPVVLGDGRRETFCMQGPPYNVAEQCNGAAAVVGGVSSEEAAQRLADDLGQVQLTITLPQGLPPLLGNALQDASATLTTALTGALQPALLLVASQLVPVMQSASLSVGESQVTVTQATVQPPEIFAQ